MLRDDDDDDDDDAYNDDGFRRRCHCQEVTWTPPQCLM